jgi:hypothetical protein
MAAMRKRLSVIFRSNPPIESVADERGGSELLSAREAIQSSASSCMN